MIKQTLEKALIADPDDLATHAAYADHLMEQGDPRGEFIQVQLILEDGNQTAAARAATRQREKELLEKHARQWLGDAGRFLVGEWSGPDKPYYYQFARGWLDYVRVLPSPDVLIAAIVRSAESRLLRRFEIIYDMRYHPFDFDPLLAGPNQALTGGETANEMYEGADIMPALLASPFLTSLRVFKLGFSDEEPIRHSTMVMPFEGCNAQQFIELLRKCPKLEELYINTDVGIESLFSNPALGNLRVLQYYFGSGYTGGQNQTPYPLLALAENSNVQKLKTLRLHPGRDTTIELEQFDALLRSPNLSNLSHLQVHMTTFGDDGAQPIVESGILRRLKVLDIAYGNMTDEGARLLASCSDLKHLDVLNVSRNALTGAGVAALKATGIQVVIDEQHGIDEQEYLYEVDVE